MTNHTNPLVDAFIQKSDHWREGFLKLRAILLAFPLSEELKWGKPCYTYENGNVVLMHGFKDYCALLFIKGTLLKDPHGVLIQQTENVQAARQVRFRNVQEITALEPILQAYIQEAITVEASGLQVDFKETEAFPMPQEFQSKLSALPALNEAFHALTPGRQRAYLLHFSAPKQQKTREARVEKCIPLILDGKGLDG